MPIFEITDPQGRKYRVNAPEGATEQDALSYVRQQQAQPRQPDAFDKSITPTGNFFENLAAGAGKAVVDTGRGLQQLAAKVGIGDASQVQQDIDEAKARDAALMQTGGGVIGNIGGQIGMALTPGMALKAASAIPGLVRAAPALSAAGDALLTPQTMAGSAALGAGLGAVQPVASGDNRNMNIALGAAGGAVAPAIGTLYRSGKALLQPFSAAGREQVAGRALNRFATDPASIDAAAGAPQLVPGSQPTLAEASGDIGLAQLERSLRNVKDANDAIAAQRIANNTARANAVQAIAGDPGQREFFAAARQQAAEDLYAKAFAENPTLTPWIKGQITQLEKRPAFQDAFSKASDLAANNGMKLDPTNAVQVAHWTKLALDDEIGRVTTAGGNTSGLMDTRNKLVSLMESKDFSPSYAEARATYAEMSKPINQMDVGQALYNKLMPALTDYGPSGQIRALDYARALRAGDQTARQATGFAKAKIEDILTPEQMASATAVAQDLARQFGAQSRGMATGSPTTQYLLGNDILNQAIKGTGIPRALINSGFAETALGRVGSFAYKPMEERIMGLLGKAATDPKEAKRLADLARQPGFFSALEPATPYFTVPGSTGLLYLGQ